jgi:hypothetical protein
MGQVEYVESENWEPPRHGTCWVFILGIALVGVGYWLLSMPLITKSGEVIYGLGSGPYGFDGWALFFYGIIVLAIVIGKTIRSWSKIPD